MAFLRRIWSKWQNLLHDEKLKHKIYVIIFFCVVILGLKNVNLNNLSL